MGFFDDLWSGATHAASDLGAGVGDAISHTANSVGDALQAVDNVGHSYLGDMYDYIPIVSDITSIGADAAHEVGDAGRLITDVSRGRESVKSALDRGIGIGERMAGTAADAGIAYTAGRLGGSAGKTWGRAAAKGAEQALGKAGGKLATAAGKQAVGAIAGHFIGDRMARKGRK